MCFTANKSYDVNFTATATGDGYWGMNAGTVVKFTGISVYIWCDEDGYISATVNIMHDAKTEDKGLCYTDSGIERAVNEFISEHDELNKIIEGVCGSEQGEQDDFIFNVDVELTDEVLKDVTAAVKQYNFEVDTHDE